LKEKAHYICNKKETHQGIFKWIPPRCMQCGIIGRNPPIFFVIKKFGYNKKEDKANPKQERINKILESFFGAHRERILDF
jgi:hypothetical protein